MPSVCLYFQIHQPYHLRRYSVFDSAPDYFDAERDETIIEKASQACYLPTTKLLLDMAKRFEGRFRVTMALSGSTIELLQEYQPQLMALLQELAATGCVEWLGQPYHHSLAYLYSRDEFSAQVQKHTALIKKLFGCTPRVFCNTGLIYNNDLPACLHGLGQFEAVLAEGADHLLDDRSPNYIYTPPGRADMKLLLRNYRISDDIALRFSNKSWPQWPLTPKKLAKWINQINGDGFVCNLYMAYESFGVYHSAESGIFDFLAGLPEALWKAGDNDFKTPSQCVASYPPAGEYDAPHTVSWAGAEHNLSAWLGNAMQANSLMELYKLEAPVKASGDPQLLEDWRRLTSCDHFHDMTTQYSNSPTSLQRSTPYESPYDAYINLMNILDNLRSRVEVAV